MPSYRTIRDDLSTLLKQHMDDREIQPAQVLYWIIVCADRLRVLHMQKRDSGAFLSSFTADVEMDTNKNNRLFISLPGPLYDMDLDRGIDYICYYLSTTDGGTETGELQRIQFWRATPGQIRVASGNTDSAPSPMNPMFYREGARLYFAGVHPDVEQVEVGVFAALPTVNQIDSQNLLDTDVPFPNELIAILQRNVLSIARWTLSLPEDKSSNDGGERTEGQPPVSPAPTTSINAPETNIQTPTP